VTLPLTHERVVGETGLFTVGYCQAGRQNAKRFLVASGRLLSGRFQRATKKDATALALRCDRLVARWRASCASCAAKGRA